MLQPNSKSKVLFIFSSYDSNSATHYPYWYELINEFAKTHDTVILFERGSGRASLPYVRKIIIQSITLKPFNLINRFFYIWQYVNLGYTKIYIHYSYWSVILAKIISLFKPITIFYWNCEKYSSPPQDKLLPLVLKLTDVLVTGSDQIAIAYRRVFNLGSKPIVIVPNWVKSLTIPQAQFPRNKINVLFVHHLSPRKGSRILPAIIRYTLKHLPSVHFHLVGSGPDKKYLKSKILNLKSADKVSFYGDLPLRQVISFYQATDYVIVPSLSEGFPRVVLEAMIYKKPLVVTTTGCITEIVGSVQRQFLVPPHQPINFAKKLISLIRSPNKHQLIRQNFIKAKSFNLNNALSALVSALS